MARLRKRRRDDRDYDEFGETLAPTAPAYRERVVESEVETVDSTAEQVVRIVGAILVGLLALRFIVALFVAGAVSGFSALVFNATEWLVTPMQALFGEPASGAGGYFDLPALAAIALVMLLAWAINALIRTTRRNVY